MFARFQLLPSARTDPELAPFRPGLVFAFFNALAWQIGIGTPMVLFAEQLGATPFQVGLAYSFIFLLTPIQIVSTALIPRYGFKAVMLGGWRTRNLFLAVPVVLTAWAMRGEQPWMVNVLVWSVFFFCFFRNIGAAAAVSWFYAILPSGARGRYFASDQFVSAVAGVGTLLACAALFALLPVYAALLAQYTIALIGSQVSYQALKRLPDGPRPTAVSLRTVLSDTPRHLFARSVFRRYVWQAAMFAVLTTPIPPFAAYYLKVGPHLSSGQIMLFEVYRYSGVMMAAWLIRRRIDVTGAKPFFLLALGLYVLAAAHWWLYLRYGFGGSWGIYGVYFVVGCGAVAWAIANLHYLPKIVSDDERTLVVSIHGAVTAVCGGLSPMLWGLLLKRGDAGVARGIDGAMFEWFFVTVAVGALLLSWRMARLPEKGYSSVEPIMIGNAVLRPLRAASYLVNLVDLRSLGRPPEPPKQ